MRQRPLAPTAVLRPLTPEPESSSTETFTHDAAEDRGDQQRLDEIRSSFGDRVADIVEACTDTVEDPKPPWRKRKEQFVAHLRTADADALLVSCADKLHNARSILRDYRTHGEKLWERFNPESDGARGQLWYYEALVEVFRDRLDNDLFAELERTVGELHRVIEAK